MGASYDALFPLGRINSWQSNPSAPSCRPPPTASHLILLMLRFFGSPTADDIVAMNPRLALPSSPMYMWLRVPPMPAELDWKLLIRQSLKGDDGSNCSTHLPCCQVILLLQSIFRWNPRQRPTASKLSTFEFLQHSGA